MCSHPQSPLPVGHPLAPNDNTIDITIMEQTGTDLIAHYLDPDRLPADRRWGSRKHRSLCRAVSDLHKSAYRSGGTDGTRAQGGRVRLRSESPGLRRCCLRLGNRGHHGFLQGARGSAMSSHLYPEISAHLLRVTPSAHWLEWQDWADPVLARPLEVRDGRVIIPEAPDNGLVWDEDAVSRYLAD